MPSSNWQICTYPGCPALVRKGRCDAHPYRKRRKTKMLSASKRGYDGAWKKRRLEYLSRHPICEYRFKCRGDPAVHVDHKRALANGGTHDDANLAACCSRCHGYKTATQDTRRGDDGRFVPGPPGKNDGGGGV